MLVFEATDQLQGQRSTDYNHALSGELVYLPLDCANPRCGCTRAFAGFDSHRATTTARLVDRPDLTIEAFSQLLADTLHDGGWLPTADAGADLVGAVATEMVEFARYYAQFGIGSVIEREGDEVFLRLPVRVA